MVPPSGTTKGNSVYKVPGGKLVKIELALETADEIKMIKDIRITGDFFMHPEDLVEELEEGLRGSKLEDAGTKIERVLVARVDAQMIGIEGRDIVHAIELADEMAS